MYQLANTLMGHNLRYFHFLIPQKLIFTVNINFIPLKWWPYISDCKGQSWFILIDMG